MVTEDAQAAYDRREEELTPDLMREIERRVVLSVLDRKWREHLYEMDYLREGIGLRAMAQRDPLVEYQREGYDMFNSMMDGIKEESVGNLFNLQFEVQENPIVEEAPDGAPSVTLGGPAAGGPPPVAAAPVDGMPPGAALPGEAGPSLPPAAFGGPAAATPAAPAAPTGTGQRGPGQGGRRQGRPRQGGQRQGGARQGGGRQGGRHAAPSGRGHATAAGRGEAATQSGGSHAAGPDTTGPGAAARGPVPAGLEPQRPRQLQYSAPTEGGGVEHRRDGSADPFANVGRNDLCPCGSGRKFKRCHGDPRNA